MASISLDSPQVRYLSERDWRLGKLMSRIGDLEYSRPDSAFQSLAHSIIEQMLSMKAGHSIEQRLVERCGGELTPQSLGGLSVDEVKACGMSLRKAQSLHALAAYATEHDLEALAERTDEEVTTTLLDLPGVEKWTCDMFLLFYLERPDVLPVEDGAVRQAFQWLYGVPITDSCARVLVCSLWHPYASTAIRYLYRALNCGLVKGGEARILWES